MSGDTPVAAPPDPPEEGGGAEHGFLLLAVLVVVGFGAWSYTGRLDVLSQAVGEVIPSTQVKSVQHLEGGIVRRILVAEGAAVALGEPLVELEPTAPGADVEELAVRITALTADVARLKAEAEDAETPSFPPDLIEAHPDLVRETTTLFEARRRKLDSDLAAQGALVRERRAEVREVNARRGNARERLKLLKEQIKISDDLLKDQLTNRMLHLNLLKEAADLRGRIAEDGATLARLDAAIAGAEIRLQTIRHASLEDVREELEEKRRSLKEYSNRIHKYRDSLQRTVLRSPVDGVVKTLYVSTVGGVVRPGDTVVEVVPAGDRLVVEARLPVQDIGYVHTGQTAMVRLASSDAVRFGSLAGRVVHVSPDSIETRDGVSFYRVRIEIEQDNFQRGSERYRLVPGVQVLCGIRTGERTVLAYLLDPFLGSLETALRER